MIGTEKYCFVFRVQAVCSQLKTMFATSQHQDSEELLIFLMSALTEGLNKACYVAV